jgi:predicted RNA-binding Zn ribbon-like protein
MDDLRPAPFFIGDDLALDFLNSVAAPWGEQIEWLASGGDLVAWLEAAHAVPADVLAQFRQRTSLRALDAVALQARELREWLRVFVRNHAGKPLAASALRELAPLNQLLERDEAYGQIEVSPPADWGRNDGDEQHALRWKALRRWHSPKSLLLPIAEAMGDLICRKNFSLVRGCEGPTCTLWFHDVSKSHARRWCTMAVCGNRAKAVAHRARRRLTAAAHNLETTSAPS